MLMELHSTLNSILETDGDVVVAPCFEREGGEQPALARAVDDVTSGWLTELYGSGEFSGKPNEMALLYRPGIRARRLAVLGAGKEPKFTPQEMRRLAGVAIRDLRGRKLRKIALALDEKFATPAYAQAAVEGALIGDYEPDQLKTDPKKGECRIESFTLIAPRDLGPAVARARVIGESQNFARDLVNLPANRLTPSALADAARAMAGETGLACEVLDRDRLRQLGMGALLGVAQGSDEPPVVIVLRYTPESETAGDHLGLIGKAVTFDTGGVSIKPAEGMEKMKYDMAGGGAVLGAMRAIAKLKPPLRISAVVPSVENMLSGRAQRPGDIVTSLNGKTVEVLNTDAEGRLILIDAITYALRLGCTHLVDAATLTGAIVVALGHVHIGAFTNDEDLLSKVMRASISAGERMWHMPLDEEYKDYLKSAFADLPNIGGRWGGAITAAKFLEEFTEGKPWVHLDIAGTAWMEDPKPFIAKGPTGVAMRTFVSLATEWAG